MILDKEANNSKEIHAELIECLLHILCDEKPLFSDLNDYYVVKEICSKISSHLIGKRFLARLQTRNDSVRNTSFRYCH